MPRLTPVILCVIALAATVDTQRKLDTSGPEANATRQRLLSNDGAIDPETPAGPTTLAAAAIAEAPAAFDNKTNGFDPQGPDYDSIDEDSVAPLASFNDNRFVFEEFETVDEGLGP